MRGAGGEGVVRISIQLRTCARVRETDGDEATAAEAAAAVTGPQGTVSLFLKVSS